MGDGQAEVVQCSPMYHGHWSPLGSQVVSGWRQYGHCQSPVATTVGDLNAGLTQHYSAGKLLLETS